MNEKEKSPPDFSPRKVFIILSSAILIPVALIAIFFLAPFPQCAQFNRAEPIKFYIYEGASPSREAIFPPGSELHEKLNSWLKEHKFGWYHSFVTYGGEIMMYSPSASMFVYNGAIILNYSTQWPTPLRSRQVIQKIDARGLLDELYTLSAPISKPFNK